MLRRNSLVSKALRYDTCYTRDHTVLPATKHEPYRDRQWFDTLIPPSHESAAVTVDYRLYFTLEWTREVSTTLYHGRHPL